jgi:1,4-dihydroxy-2-naphthoate octaprenyltransferase
MTERTTAIAGAVLLFAGIVLGVANVGFVGNLLGIVLGGIGGVAVVAAVFYAIGRSEDREREGREGR